MHLQVFLLRVFFLVSVSFRLYCIHLYSSFLVSYVFFFIFLFYFTFPSPSFFSCSGFLTFPFFFSTSVFRPFGSVPFPVSCGFCAYPLSVFLFMFFPYKYHKQIISYMYLIFDRLLKIQSLSSSNCSMHFYQKTKLILLL